MPIIDVLFASQVLGGNPLRDPATRRIPIYVPADYATSGMRYPVVYFLAGFSSRGTTLLNESAWDETMPARLDRLIGGGAVRPLIMVMPDCMTTLGGSQYINSTGTGRYEDHVIHELVPFVDATYRTLPVREARVVMGKSSGGYGATVLAMRHPDVFGLAVDHSGDKYFELCYKADIPKCVAGLAPYGHSAAQFLHDFPHPPEERGRHWFDVVNMLAMASCYAPNPGSPAGFDLPFDAYTGELRADVWQRWLAHDPIELTARHAEALRSLQLYFLDCGRFDEHHLQYGARIYAQRLKALGVAHRYEEFGGGHRNIAYRYDVSLQAVSAALPRG
jgi:S-formylglutathione hydrolase FrmB